MGSDAALAEGARGRGRAVDEMADGAGGDDAVDDCLAEVELGDTTTVVPDLISVSCQWLFPSDGELVDVRAYWIFRVGVDKRRPGALARGRDLFLLPAIGLDDVDAQLGKLLRRLRGRIPGDGADPEIGVADQRSNEGTALRTGGAVDYHEVGVCSRVDGHGGLDGGYGE